MIYDYKFDLQNSLNVYQNRLKIALKRKTEIMRLRYEKVLNSKVYKEPFQKVNDYYMEIEKYLKIMENSCYTKFKDAKILSTKLISKLDALSPLKTLTRGYCLVEKDNRIIAKATELEQNMIIDLRFQDGDVSAKII